MPILHDTGVDVKVDARKMVVLAAMPDDQGQWTQRVIDWDNEYYGVELCSTHRKCLRDG